MVAEDDKSIVKYLVLFSTRKTGLYDREQARVRDSHDKGHSQDAGDPEAAAILCHLE